MSPAEIIGLLLASFKESPLAQAIIVFYLAILAFRQLVNIVTSPDEGWYARRMRRLRQTRTHPDALEAISQIP